MRLPSLSNLSKGFATAFHIKGVESNRLPLPQANYVSGSGSLYGMNEMGDILNAIRGVNIDQKSIDFKKEAGDFRQNSIVALCQNWIGTSFPQAPPRIGEWKNGKIEAAKGMDDHDVLKLMRRPNARYSGKWLTWSLTDDWFPVGNAYTHIVTDGKNNLSGKPVELEWLPATAMCPKADSTGHLAYYEYTSGGVRHQLDPKEVIHFRYGIDRLNPLAGLSPLAAQMRFIAADNAGAAYSASLLVNGGIPPAILVPQTVAAGGAGGNALPRAAMTPQEAAELTESLAQKFKNDPGKLVFLSNAVQLLMLGYKPSEMALNELMEEPETRIPAAYGIPPEVLKLRVGLLHSTESNIKESRKAAWQDCLAPCQDHFADTWTTQFLIPRYGDDKYVVFYDRSEIGVLQEDMSETRGDAVKLYSAGVIDRADAKTMVKVAVNETEDRGHYATGGDSQAEPDPTDPTDPAATDKKPIKTPDKTQKKNTGRYPSSVKADVDPALSDLEKAALKFRAALKNKEDDAVGQMRTAYKAARERIDDNLVALIQKMKDAEAAGETITPSWLAQEKRYRQLLQQIEDELFDLGEKQTPVLEGAQLMMAQLSEEHTPALTAIALGAPPQGVKVQWNTLPTRTIENIVGNASDGSPLADLLSEWGEDISKTLRQEIVTAVVLGQGADAVARQIYAVVGDVDPETGNKGIALHRAENIARTELHRAARQVTREQLAQNADITEGWTWGASLDSRCCSCCWAMHGTVHPLSETLDGHPSCRCVMIPRTKSWAEITGDDSILDTRPVTEDGSAKFAALPAETQQTILGPERYRRYRDGEITLADCVTRTHNPRWGSMRREATVAEAEQNAASN